MPPASDDVHKPLGWREELRDLGRWGNPPFLQRINRKYRWFTRGDVDSFFALFLDNLSSILGIINAMVEVGQIAQSCFGPPETCTGADDPEEWGGICPLDAEKVGDGLYEYNGATGAACPGLFVQSFNDMLFGKVLPGIAFALLFGNLWYAWMAGKLAGYEDRIDVTALPYGVNTPAGFLAAYSIMLPLAFKFITEPDPDTWADQIWKGGASAVFVTGLFEISGMFFGNALRRNLSSAALYGPITAVGFVWLAFIPMIDFAREPLIGILPFALCFIGFFANKGGGIYPTSLTSVAILTIGIVLKWLNVGKFNPYRDEMADEVNHNWDEYAGKNTMGAFVTLEGFKDVGDAVAIVVPVALQSFIETMENVDLAGVLGDNYNVREAMLVDGLGTCIGALFGATLPTTVYIGHIRHKRLGATAGYSISNGVAYFVLLMSGIFPAIFSIVDQVSVGMILLFVGLIVVQTAFERSASRHFPALCIGLFFVIADPWFFDMFPAGASAFSEPCTRNLDRYYGLGNMMPGGGILCSLVVTQIVCDMIDLRFVRGGVWALIACLLSEFGFMHGNNPVADENGAVREDRVVVEGSAEAATERGQVLVSYIDGSSYKQFAFYPGGTAPVDVNQSWGLNESWRWACAYAVLALFLFAHVPFQYFGKIPQPLMDNGRVDGHIMIGPEDIKPPPTENGEENGKPGSYKAPATSARDQVSSAEPAVRIEHLETA